MAKKKQPIPPLHDRLYKLRANIDKELIGSRLKVHIRPDYIGYTMVLYVRQDHQGGTWNWIKLHELSCAGFRDLGKEIEKTYQLIK